VTLLTCTIAQWLRNGRVAEPPVIPILSKIRTNVRKMLSMQGLAKHFVVAKSVISDQAAYGNLRGLESGEFPPYQTNG
jgi:hypothetical protein